MENLHEKIHEKIKVNNEKNKSPKENTVETTAKTTLKLDGKTENIMSITTNNEKKLEKGENPWYIIENNQRKHIEFSKNEKKINPFESKVVKNANSTIKQALKIAENQMKKISNHGKINPVVVPDCKRKLATFKNGAGSYTYIPRNLRKKININCSLFIGLFYSNKNYSQSFLKIYYIFPI